MSIQRWRKLGLVYAPAQDRPWNQHYGMLPTPILLAEQQRIRIYFATTDADFVGSITYLEVDAADPTRVLYTHPEPVLGPGESGLFDCFGVNPAVALQSREGLRIYYVGHQRTLGQPYMLYTGLAIQPHGETHFRRFSQVPIIDRNPLGPFSAALMYVIERESDYMGWFVLFKQWLQVGGKPYMRGEFHAGWSDDGTNWKIHPEAGLKPIEGVEYSIGRPWVLYQSGTYRMWFSSRRIAEQGYRLAYAESTDGVFWNRLDVLQGLDVAPEPDAFDHEMICYSALIQVGPKVYMFYNGNRNGRTGFGTATLESL